MSTIPEITFLGAGRMASAIIGGLIHQKTYPPAAILCTCGDDPSGPELARRTGIHYSPDPLPFLRREKILVLACKPQQLASLNPDYAEASEGMLVLSILAGTTLARLSKAFPKALNIVRTMPNTPGQIGAGVTAYTPSLPLEPEDEVRVHAILAAMGRHIGVNESELDAVTALSGSGPAYLFAFAEALRDAGIRLGLSPATADLLTRETLAGSGMLLRQSEETPEALRHAVTSPGGTTAAALAVFEQSRLHGIVEEALTAARDRSIELGKA